MYVPPKNMEPWLRAWEREGPTKKGISVKGHLQMEISKW